MYCSDSEVLLLPEFLKMGTQSFVVFTFLLIISLFHVPVFSVEAPSTSITQQCSSEFAKLGVCLTFASGKADTPTKDCCATISEKWDKHVVCICYVLQQAHNGVAQLKILGIQEVKLLELPTACKIANARFSNCLGLLNLAPGSPDTAIFNSTTTTTAPVATAPSGATPTTTSTPRDSQNSEATRPGSKFWKSTDFVPAWIFAHFSKIQSILGLGLREKDVVTLDEDEETDDPNRLKEFLVKYKADNAVLRAQGKRPI